MASVKIAYASAVSITCTITSLGSASARQSTVIDNTTNLYDDAMVSLIVKTGTIVAPSTVEVYAYSIAGDNTSYTDAATGSDAAYIMVSPTNLRLIGVISAPSNATTYACSEMSVAQAFGGNLPSKWGIVVVNKTGAALDATIGSCYYRGVTYTVA